MLAIIATRRQEHSVGRKYIGGRALINARVVRIFVFVVGFLICRTSAYAQVCADGSPELLGYGCSLCCKTQRRPPDPPPPPKQTLTPQQQRMMQAHKQLDPVPKNSQQKINPSPQVPLSRQVPT